MNKFDTPFKQEIIKKLEDKGLSPNSIKMYVRNLEILNDDLPLKNINFLKDKDVIINKISNRKPTTQRSYLVSITVILGVLKGENKQINKLYDDYYKTMMETISVIRNNHTNEVPEEKKENFITWKEVEQKHNELKTKVENFIKNKEINTNQYNTLLDYVILSLYVFHPPRRNTDYQKLFITDKSQNLPLNMNYLDLSSKKFVFNVFKTAKKEGQVVIDIDPRLFEVIQMYLKFHPLFPQQKKLQKNISIPFLVDVNGKPFEKVNDMTRILNRIFGKRIGSSMLRSIYLTDKYSDLKKEQETDAKKMSHSVSTQQNEYVKNKDK